LGGYRLVVRIVEPEGHPLRTDELGDGCAELVEEAWRLAGGGQVPGNHRQRAQGPLLRLLEVCLPERMVGHVDGYAQHVGHSTMRPTQRVVTGAPVADRLLVLGAQAIRHRTAVNPDA